jgi:tetratricopeptide (TPR) repeat protein
MDDLAKKLAAGKQRGVDSALLAGGGANPMGTVSTLSPASSGTQSPISRAHRPWVLALSLVPWLAVALGFALLTRNVQGTEALVAPTSWWQRPLVAADALAFYLAKLGLPMELAPDYGRSPTWLRSSGWMWITWLLPFGLAALLCFPRIPEAWRGVLVAWRRAGLVSLALLLPVLGLVPFAFQRFSTVADRYAYLAMLGPAIVIATLAAQARSRVAHLAIAVSLVVLALTSAAQSRHWSSSAALFIQALTVNPTSTVALNGLGNVDSQRGDWPAALVLYRRAVAADPTNASSWFNVGRAELALGHPLPAIEVFEQALRFRPDYDKVRLPFAAALVAVQRVDDAAVQIEALLARRPDDAIAWENLGRIRAFQNRRIEAIAHFERALVINPQLDSARQELARLKQPADGATKPAP